MAERPWAKMWRSWWTSVSHRKIGSDALLIGLALLSFVRWRKGEDCAWAEHEDGSPIELAVIADYAQMSVARADTALWKLAARKTVACRTDGAWGMPKFGRWQETADAAKKRQQRGQSRDIPATVPKDIPPHADGDADADVVSLRETPKPPSGASASLPVDPKPSKPKGKPRKPRTDYPDGLEEHFLAELQRACRDFRGRQDAGPRKVTDGMRDELRKLYAAEEPTTAEITRAVNRRLELNRAGDQYGDLTWEHLCRPASFRRYRDAMPAGPNGKPPGDDEPPDWMLE